MTASHRDAEGKPKTKIENEPSTTQLSLRTIDIHKGVDMGDMRGLFVQFGSTKVLRAVWFGQIRRAGKSQLWSTLRC